MSWPCRPPWWPLAWLTSSGRGRIGQFSSGARHVPATEDHMPDRLISCDDHMDLSQLPADLWTTRLPAALLDGAPRVEEQDGQAVWVCDGKVWAAGMASRRRRVRRGRSRR